MTTLYHNPRCSKSREALKLLEEHGETIEIYKYLSKPLDILQIKQLLELLKIEPIALVRTQEKIWKDNYQGRSLLNEDIIEALAKIPQLMERPIAVKGTKAVIGRPPENVLSIL